MMVNWLKPVRLKLLVIILNILHSGSSYLNTGNISCSQNLDSLHGGGTADQVMVVCPASCLEKVYCIVYGSNQYLSSSSICCAAIHSGVLANSDGGQALITISREALPHVFGNPQNGVKSRNYRGSSVPTFSVKPALELVKHAGSITNLDDIGSRSTTTKATSTSLPEETDTRTSSDDKVNAHIATRSPTTISNEPPTTPFPTQDISRSTTLEMISDLSGMLLSSASKNLVITGFQEETEANTPQYTTTYSNDIQGSRHSPLTPTAIGIGAGLFLLGLIIGGCVFHVFRRIKKHDRGRHCTESRTKSTRNTSRVEETDVCVCYHNLNTSHQGLLTDPETCDRPCPIRKPLMYDQSLRVSEYENNRTLISFETESPNCATYEECASGCSAKCDPSQFDF